MFGHWHDLEKAIEPNFTMDWDLALGLGVLTVLTLGFIWHWRETNRVDRVEEEREEKRKKLVDNGTKSE